MYFDAQNLYSEDQAIVATAVSTNRINHGAARQLGIGEPMWLAVFLTVAMTDAGSDSTVTVTLETDTLTAFPSATITVTLPVFPAVSPVGTRRLHRLGEGDINEQFSRLRYTVAGGDLSTGSFFSALTKDIDAFTAYARGYTVS